MSDDQVVIVNSKYANSDGNKQLAMELDINKKLFVVKKGNQV